MNTSTALYHNNKHYVGSYLGLQHRRKPHHRSNAYWHAQAKLSIHCCY